MDLNFQVKKPVSEAIDIRQAAQKAEDDWSLERQRLQTEYEQLELELESLKSQELELSSQVQSARERVAAKESQIAEVTLISSQIEPFLKELLDKLGQLVAADMPFLPEERNRRLEKLSRLLETPGISVSEKFDKVMEAFLIEAEYGNTVEVYQDNIRIEGQTRLVNIFRLGRISLFYQTQDKTVSGLYDVAASDWRTLPSSCNSVIQEAIEIGTKRRPVDILSLPIGRMHVK